MLEHNALVQTRNDECRSIKLAQNLALADAQKTNTQHFNIDLAKRNRVSELDDRTNRRKFRNVVGQRYQPDPIIKLICTELKNDSLKLHMVRKNSELGYTKLVKYGYNVWIQIQEIISKHKCVHTQEVKLAIQKRSTKSTS